MQDKSCLAPKVNMENSSEIGEKPFCGKEMRRALGLGFLRHRDLTSLKKKKKHILGQILGGQSSVVYLDTSVS